MENYEKFRHKTYININLVLLLFFSVINFCHNFQHVFFISEISAGIITFNILNIFLFLTWLVMKKGYVAAGTNLMLVTLSVTVIALNLYISQFYNHNNILIIFPVLLAIFIASRRTALLISLFNFAAIFLLDVFHKSYDDPISYFVLAGIMSAIIGVAFLLKNMIARLEVMRRQHINELYIATLKILGYISELRDRETTNHLERVSIITAKLVARVKKISRYSNYITESYISDIIKASMLHDIGKIGISDYILQKQGKLDEKEYEEMKRHTILGAEILKKAGNDVSGRSIFTIALEIARHHHERWDGNGYPDNLRGDNIPLSARIMAVADVYDALVSDRPYKKGIRHEEAVAIIKGGSGTQFDPDIVKCFHHVQKEIYRETHKLL